MLALLALAALSVAPKTVAYVSGGGDGQSLDLYPPAAGKKAPVLVFFHGGVWHVGDKSQYRNIGEAFAARGILTAIANYRLAPRVTHPEQVADTAAAVAWVLEHAGEYGGDPAQVHLAGHSAGGELISTVLFGAMPPAVAGIIPICGIFDLTQPIADEEGGGFEDFIYPVFGRNKAALAAASPLGKVAATKARILVTIAGEDSRAMQAQSHGFEHALQAKRIPFETFTAAHRGHFELPGELGTPGDPATDRIAAFVLRKEIAEPVELRDHLAPIPPGSPLAP